MEIPIDIACIFFYKGSNCPHYDGEVNRRPSFHRMLAANMLLKMELQPMMACLSITWIRT
ncbi:hypothetical protein [Cytobacillus sp. NCCP-133]|uniref:hypothetical protein n=1 Tax=Cytobacillus sp. NCCP-133 TaxID=766848 RepID=UPI00223180FB|nr:hypothetical protein [Cytobacillus sp. NCCP-133]